ncbi:hypothetical protein HK105_208195 [Polyrhizophydium stewartii]|uniref:G-protein coupled receptors family 3 profile domain-containing protein n=1 Tax=Polyrhizophydium stewartii TaxID=2732419 RepID=A0ABR4MYP6_9FUNG
MALSALISKSARVLAAFAIVLSKWLSPLKRLKPKVSGRIPFVATVITVILLGLITLVEPIISSEVYIEASGVTRYVCTKMPSTPLLWILHVWIGIQMIVLFVLAAGLTGLPDIYNDSRSVAASTGLMLLFTVISLLLGENMRTVQVQFVVETLCCAVGSIAVLLITAGTPLSLFALSIVRTVLGDEAVLFFVRIGTALGSIESTSSNKPIKLRESRIAAIRLDVQTMNISAEVSNDAPQIKSNMKQSSSIHATMMVGKYLGQWTRVSILVLDSPVFAVRLVSRGGLTIEYLPLTLLTNLQYKSGDSRIGSKQCEITFGKRKILFHFSTPAAAIVWADAVGRALLAMCRIDAVPDDKRAVCAVVAEHSPTENTQPSK